MFFCLGLAMALSCQLRPAGVVPRLVRVKGIAVLIVLLALAAASAGEAKRQPVTVRVMTRNLYLGTNLDTIVQAKSTREAFAAVEQGWANVQANDFPTRARAIAREIATAKPDFVGFQELSLYRTQTPADFTVTPATTVALDYAREIRKALAARKLHYRFVGISAATDAELPSGDPPKMDIRLTVRDGLLVRIDKKIKIKRVRTGLYATTTPLFGGFVIAKRGWVLADATVGGRTFRVITTHLESFNDTSQVAQGQELAQGPAATSLPTILLGDLNSRADGTGTPTRANLLDAGFKDAWPEAHPADIGLTCCHGDDLREVGGPFYSRIDMVLLRNGFRALGAGILGESPGDRLGGLWPSDHAGVWARVRLN
jgi:endonuclease/exonuclease/phosphatase family metal-dependent hydrolase